MEIILATVATLSAALTAGVLTQVWVRRTNA